MTPEQLTTLLRDWETCVEVVEAMGDANLQLRRGWDLDGWHYHLIPWGVRFCYDGRQFQPRAEVMALLEVDAVTGDAIPRPGHDSRRRIVLKFNGADRECEAAE
jgi:hypothetical protein